MCIRDRYMGSLCDNWNVEKLKSIASESAVQMAFYAKTTYIDKAIMMSYDAFNKNVKDYLREFVIIATIRLPCFFLVLVLLYFLVYESFLDQLRDEIWSTTGMLGLIPTKLLIRNKDLRKSLLSNKPT
eukprot:TRINITY_DN8948_c0_g1_i3.p1 TRINITY_DN8948_c0_g1~~TRINITY_DN8948_c0_g1_i3.p1  ORF type:complete len:128 (+),score=14.07 TRINITY_DN8948_c0_g1_i3:66-449(+)